MALVRLDNSTIVDANRSLADIDPELLADDWPVPLAPSRKTAQGIGLVWRVARDGELDGGPGRTVGEARRRLTHQRDGDRVYAVIRGIAYKGSAKEDEEEE